MDLLKTIEDETRITPRQQRAIESRRRILAAALKLFATQGFAATSTRQIAGEVGVTEGLIFRYFPDKAALLTALVGQPETFAGAMLTLLNEAAERPAREVLSALALGWVNLVGPEADLTAILLSEGQINQELGTLLNEVSGEATQRLARYLDARAKAGELRTDLAFETSATMFLSSLIVFFLTRRQKGVDQAQATLFADALVTTFLQMAQAQQLR